MRDGQNSLHLAMDVKLGVSLCNISFALQRLCTQPAIVGCRFVIFCNVPHRFTGLSPGKL